MQRISCNLPYTVMDHAPVDGAASSGPSPSWYEQAAAHFVPSGGKAGQVLAKASDTDLDVEWTDGGGGTADHAKLSNRDASDQHPISAITGLKAALDAKQPAGSYLTQESDPTVPDWAKQPEKPSYTADEVGALSAATLPEAITTALAQATASGAFDGADGQDGITPTIGENGNWYLGETDTGKPSRGETGPAGADGRDGADGQPGENGTDGYSPTANVTQTDSGATITITDKNGTTTATVTNGKDGADGNPGADGSPGKDGADGKSAYQYAQEGGYTGTEAEFAAKLAEEMPEALPNPNALTFTGAVTGSYDGSAPLEVNIPSGGGAEAEHVDILSEGTLSEDVANIVVDGFAKRMIALAVAPYGSTANSGTIKVRLQLGLDNGESLTINPTIVLVTNSAAFSWNKIVAFAFVDADTVDVTIYRDGMSNSTNIYYSSNLNFWRAKQVYTTGVGKITSVTIGLQADGVIGKNTSYKVVGA